MEVDPEQTVVRVSGTRRSLSLLFDFVNTFSLDVALSGRAGPHTPHRTGGWGGRAEGDGAGPWRTELCGTVRNIYIYRIRDGRG